MVQLRKVLSVVAVLAGVVGVASAEGWREERVYREPVRVIRYERPEYRIRPIVREEIRPIEVIRPRVEFVEPVRFERPRWKHEVIIQEGFRHHC